MNSDIRKMQESFSEDEEERLLLVRVTEFLDRADKGMFCSSDFLNLGEQYLIRKYLTALGRRESVDYCFWGGYTYAERCMLCLLPDYLSSLSDGADFLFSFCEGEHLLSAVKIEGSGYVSLGHRDYLGSLLYLGIERRVLGDFVIPDEHHAAIIAKKDIVEFIVSNLDRIGRDKVRCSVVTDNERLLFPDTKRFVSLTDTVASLRLDCLVASFTNQSRDKAKQAVTSGQVEVNFRVITSPDEEVPENAYVSIKGYGRFRFVGAEGMSKKGRLRVRAIKFV